MSNKLFVRGMERCALFLMSVVLLSLGCRTPAQTAAQHHVFFRVQAAPSVAIPLNGRLLIFLKQGSGDKDVDTDAFHSADTWVAAREVRNLAPGGSVDVDADEVEYPSGFSEMPAGKYEAQAVLDVDHSYNYSGRGPQDWESAATSLGDWSPASGAAPGLTLDRHPVEDPKRAEAIAKAKEEAAAGGVQLEEFVSPVLSSFWGRPMQIKAWVVLPYSVARPGVEWRKK